MVTLEPGGVVTAADAFQPWTVHRATHATVPDLVAVLDPYVRLVVAGRMLEVRVKSALDVVKHKLGRLLLQLVPEVPERPAATRIEQRTVEAHGSPDPEEEVSHASQPGWDRAVAQDARSRPGRRPGIPTARRGAG